MLTMPWYFKFFASRVPDPWPPAANPQPATKPLPPLPAALTDFTLHLAQPARRFNSIRFI